MSGLGARQVSILGNRPGDSGSNPTSPHQLSFKLVKGSAGRLAFNQFVIDHHSYTPSSAIVGKTINWLIYFDSNLVGCFGLQNMMIPLPKVLDNFIGWKTNQQPKDYVTLPVLKIANNWRFCLDTVPKNLASKILKIMVHEAKKAWQEIIGEPLLLIYSYVGGGHTGVCYKAAGRQCIGETTGWSYVGGSSHKKYDSKFIDPALKKLIFVRPLHRYWQRELKKKGAP